MQEVKKPRKPLIYYYIIVLLVLLLFNFLAMPLLLQRQVQEVDYGTFLQMAEDQELGQVEVQQQDVYKRQVHTGAVTAMFWSAWVMRR